MAFIRRVRTKSGATAVQVAEYRDGRQRMVKHFGSAHTEVEVGVMVEMAEQWLANPAQGVFDVDVARQPGVSALVGDVTQRALFAARKPSGRTDSAGRVTSTASLLLFETLAAVYDDIGFGVVGDDVFADLVVARIVEPTSLLDNGRVLVDLGQHPAPYATLKRTVTRAASGTYRHLAH